MSRIPALDEITTQLGRPVMTRWVPAPHRAVAAVVRLQHRGGTVDLSASRSFRLILQLLPSHAVRTNMPNAPASESISPGSIITPSTNNAERIRIQGPTDALHLLFSPEFLSGISGSLIERLSPVRFRLQAAAVQMLVAASLDGSEQKLTDAVSSLATLIVEHASRSGVQSGGLKPSARQVVQNTLRQQLVKGVSVSELSQLASLSLHHFIKSFRQSEGVTPHSLLVQKRIEKSVEMLLHRRCSFAEVAMLTGFSSASHLVYTFRRLVGVTPGALRRACEHRATGSSS